jgi:hypothetical protein
VEDDVNVLKRGAHGFLVLHVALAKLGPGVNPRRLAELVRVGLQIVEDADGPALANEQVNNVRSDEPGAAGNQRALLSCSHEPLFSSHDGYATESGAVANWKPWLVKYPP